MSDYKENSYESFDDLKLDPNDSFGKNIDSIKNDENKNSAKFEAQNNQRPLSKYHRDKSPSGKEDEKFDEQKFLDQFNSHLQSNKVKMSDFAENLNLFVDRDELRDMFRKVHFEIKLNELKQLLKNSGFDDEFISLSNFLQKFNFNFYKPNVSQLDSQSESLYGTSKEETHNRPQLTDFTLQNKKTQNSGNINEEFASFKNDILNIVERTTSAKPRKKLPPIKNEDKKKKNPQKKPKKDNDSSNVDSEDSGPMTSETPNNSTRPKSNIAKKGRPIDYFIKKKKKEDQIIAEMNKLAMEKRDKEYQRECVRKMVQANEFAEQLNIPKSYSAYAEEGDTAILCRIFDKETKTSQNVSLKKFMSEYNNLKKKIDREEQRKTYQIAEVDKTKDKKQEDFFRMNRKQKHQVIKQILKESLELKIQLKKQLKALRDKNIIDSSIINKNLRLTNLDDDSII